MRALFTNNWFIGITTGIISGLVVFVITRSSLSGEAERERREKVSAANREVVYSLRAFVAEQKAPTREVVIALTASTARKFGVDVSEMLDTVQVAEDLLKEIMDSSFLSSDSKRVYCEMLNSLLLRDIKTDRKIDIRGEEPSHDIALGYAISASAGLTATIVVAALSIWIASHKSVSTPVPLERIWASVAVIVLFGLFAFAMRLFLESKDHRRIIQHGRKIRREMERALNYAQDYGLASKPDSDPHEADGQASHDRHRSD
jgi:hypothetical protein